MTMQAAVFSDVEGTLVDGSIPRMSLALGRRMGIFPAWQLARVGAIAAGAQVLRGNLRRRAQLESVVQAMAGRTSAEVEQLVEALLPLVMARLKPAMHERLREHAEAGLPLYFVSGGLHEAVVRIGAELGGQGEGTKLLQRNGRYLPRLDGPACQGEGKAARARTLLAAGGYDPAQCFAYGDTASDIPFLALFGHPCAVDPDAGLAAEARKRGWPILRTGA
jgi:HAD superfamily hydrolase (TIGR01490 family)